MSDLNVVAVIKSKPGSEAQLHQALSALAVASRAEAGCASYELFQSAVDSTTFVTTEKWRSQADLDAHMQTAHIAHALQVGGALMDGPPAIHPLKPLD